MTGPETAVSRPSARSEATPPSLIKAIERNCAAGPAGLGWATAGPSAVGQSVRELVDQIVRAVCLGDDPRIRDLLVELAAVADAQALLHLRQQLYEAHLCAAHTTEATPSPLP